MTKQVTTYGVTYPANLSTLAAVIAALPALRTAFAGARADYQAGRITDEAATAALMIAQATQTAWDAGQDDFGKVTNDEALKLSLRLNKARLALHKLHEAALKASGACMKCGGAGHITTYTYHHGGVCFACDGTGRA